MYKKEGLKFKLLQQLKKYGTITRKELYTWSRNNGYEQATTERRVREMANEVGVIPLNEDGKRARINLSEHIVAYKWKPTTVFNF
jgi:hypothetical protein